MTHKFVCFNRDDIPGLAELGINRIFVEVSATGQVVREIGFDDNGLVIYRFPGNDRFGKYGLFDNATVDTTHTLNALSREEFERLYKTEN
ncbi:hypothetical protein [Novosphingobium album (ex Liu et al. 2023)]|uniref:Uncharacterized protein n=1 Tax=Novosphingobium album (ex Liu et al. 2023) TaxID=3031130 RepID=A0ABT5WP63_9SPHN|nr:hypothetical protein [Novosphingobium album (ex Liu et al. 2023)]MDE8651833.1 hypothetical protein [Novosphingobium album (ex Liu et al. 2023)]